MRIAGADRWLAIEDAGRVRDALGVALPVGVPEAFTEPVADPLGDLLSRYARTRGPFARRGGGGAVRAGRLGGAPGCWTGWPAPVGWCAASCGPVRDAGHRPAGMEYCDADVLRRLRRASLARLRAEVEPVEQAALGRFLPAWHGIKPSAEGRLLRAPPSVEDVLSVIEQLAGAPLPASAVESLILPARLPGYSPALLDELTASGEVSWTGCGALAGGDGWIVFAPSRRRRPAAARSSRTRRTVRCTGAVLSAVGRWGAVLPAAGRPRRAAAGGRG